MTASLMIVKSDGTSQEIVLRQERVVVGREKSAPLRVPARSVSRQHCEFVLEGSRLVLRDLGSSNGTFVNRERVSEAELHAGDLVSVGPAVFAVRIDGRPEDFDPSDVYARGAVEQADDAPSVPSSALGAQAAAALAGGIAGDAEDSDLAMGALAGDADDSSLLDFDFDLGDDEDDEEQQPDL
ncbi:MAG: FHA domain-containing protein [Phycisphaerales bacterium]